MEFFFCSLLYRFVFPSFPLIFPLFGSVMTRSQTLSFIEYKQAWLKWEIKVQIWLPLLVKEFDQHSIVSEQSFRHHSIAFWCYTLTSYVIWKFWFDKNTYVKFNQILEYHHLLLVEWFSSVKSTKRWTKLMKNSVISCYLGRQKFADNKCTSVDKTQ